MAKNENKIGKKSVEKMVDDLGDFVNDFSCDQNGFAESVMRQHRTLQQNLMRLMLRTMEEWATQEHSDLRNEYTVETSRKIICFLEREGLYYRGTKNVPFI